MDERKMDGKERGGAKNDCGDVRTPYKNIKDAYNFSLCLITSFDVCIFNSSIHDLTPSLTPAGY